MHWTASAADESCKSSPESRAKFDNIVKRAAVDAALLKGFHTPRSFSSASAQKSYVRRVHEQFEAASRQKFQAEQFLLPEIGVQFHAPLPKCNLCGDATGGPKKAKFGVKCTEDHFVCSACYQSLCIKPPRACSAQEAQHHYLGARASAGLVECKEGTCFACFAVLRHDSLLRFPAYWKTKDEGQFQKIENPFMVQRMQDLIRESVRPACGSGCRGRDGDGSGTKLATVTKVFRIENGPVWKRYWERKQQMLKGRKPNNKLTAATMDRVSQCGNFPSVQVSNEINELLLFHGTSEDSANSIAKGGFDPTKANLMGLYGAGTYCADYSCKSMQYTPATGQGERVFIICRVLMGRAYHSTTSLRRIKEPPEDQKGQLYDSVYAKEGKSMGGKQTHNEYVTYDAGQVYPEYLVYIKL